MARELRRKTPEEALRECQAEEAVAQKGHLKIFLGYASGVGKSFRMLDEARRIFSFAGIEAELTETRGPGDATEMAYRASAEGRQLVIARPGGSQTTAAVFFSNERLYQLETTMLAGGSNSDLIRFQQSLTFDRNVANRTAEQMAAYRAACVGVNANPAGLDDPRCVRQ